MPNPYDDRDDEFAPPPDPHETRTVLRQVAAYRVLHESVRKKATGSIFFGLFMLAIWYALDGRNNDWSLFSIIYLSLGLLELSVGLLNRLWPSAEGILLDGLVLLGFAASNLIRQYFIWRLVGNKGISPVFLVFGVLWAFQGMQTIRSYFQIRRAMPARPTAEHLRWFDGLVRELRLADPQADTRELALPTEPFLTGKLLGDTAFFLEPSGTVIIAAREDVTIERIAADGQGIPAIPARGYLTIEGAEFPPFKLSDANWSNYVAWKREGGEDPLRTG
jgi:hypothetical protein